MKKIGKIKNERENFKKIMDFNDLEDEIDDLKNSKKFSEDKSENLFEITNVSYDEKNKE